MKRYADFAAVGLLCLASLWLGTLAYHNHWAHSDRASPGPTQVPPAIIGTTLSGRSQTLDTRGLEQPTLLLVLSVDCRFCEKNAQNWQELVAALRESESPPQVIALSLSGADDTRRYLENHGLEVEALLIDRAEMQALGLRGVPSTIALDAGSQTLRSWAGVLNQVEKGTILTWARAS